MRHISPDDMNPIHRSPSVFISLPVIQGKKMKKKCCKKYKKSNRCKRCPGQKVMK